jgi:hypothetical protein
VAPARSPLAGRLVCCPCPAFGRISDERPDIGRTPDNDSTRLPRGVSAKDKQWIRAHGPACGAGCGSGGVGRGRLAPVAETSPSTRRSHHGDPRRRLEGEGQVLVIADAQGLVAAGELEALLPDRRDVRRIFSLCDDGRAPCVVRGAPSAS